MEKEIIYNDIVNASECDWKSELSIVGAFQKVQNAICSYMEHFELDGITLINKYNATWIFAKNKIDIFKRVKWNEKIYAKCFFSSKSIARCVADIVFYDNNDELCFYAQIELCAIDLESKKIRRLSSVGFDKMETREALVDSKFEKINGENLTLCLTKTIGLSNIDYNYHTNNTEYIRFILDTYSLEDFDKKSIKRFQIDYLNQSKIGDTLSVNKLTGDDSDIIVIRNNEADIVKCQVFFN